MKRNVRPIERLDPGAKPAKKPQTSQGQPLNTDVPDALEVLADLDDPAADIESLASAIGSDGFDVSNGSDVSDISDNVEPFSDEELCRIYMRYLEEIHEGVKVSGMSSLETLESILKLTNVLQDRSSEVAAQVAEVAGQLAAEAQAL